MEPMNRERRVSQPLQLASIRRLLFFRALHETDVSGFFINKDLVNKSVNTARSAKNDLDGLCAMVEVWESSLARRKRLDAKSIYDKKSHPALMAAFPICFLLGLTSNYLGSSSEVNLLLNPLTALLAWNFCVYLLILMPVRLGFGNLFGSFFQGALNWFREKRAGHGLPGSDAEVLNKTRLKFWKLWFQTASEVVTRKSAVLFHGFALALTAGVVAGLYLRGLALEYQFVWQSTFIKNPETANTLLKTLFFPITLIRGDLPALTGPNGADWIHVFALIAGAYIGLPRLLLAAFSLVKSNKAAAQLSIDLNDPYYLNLLAPLKGGKTTVGLYAYSYTLSDKVLAVLTALFKTYWGRELKLDAVRSIPWGEETLAGVLDSEDVRIVCFNGAQTPEEEIHGVFSENLAHAQKAQVLLSVDISRLQLDEEARKKTLWRAVLNRPIFFFRDSDSSDALLSQLKQSVSEVSN